MRKDYNDFESDDMTYEAPLDREICPVGLYDFDAFIRGVVLSGSWCSGLEGKSSDLDVVVVLCGNEREDDLFNLFHDDKFSIGGICVDINPITEYRIGTLEEYLPGVERYLEEKRQKEKKSEI